jgi:hypothetical protein
MPRNSRALLSAEIRTAANRGSPRPMLSWAFYRFDACSVNRMEPVARPLSLCASKNRTRRARALRGASEAPDLRMTGFRRTWSDIIRASTRTCPRVLPTTVMS